MSSAICFNLDQSKILSSDNGLIVYSPCTGEWNDDHCTLTKRFVCKKPTGGVAKVVTPTPYPVGGCKGSFVRVPGGRKLLLLCEFSQKHVVCLMKFLLFENVCTYFVGE